MQTNNIDNSKVRAIDIKNVIKSEAHISFKRSRASYCPFCNSGNHNTKNSDSAFNINLAKNTFRCFSCGKGSSVIDFIMHFKKIGFKEAKAYLISNYLGGLESISDTSEVTKAPISNQPTIEYIPKEIFTQSLENSDSNFHQYLRNIFPSEDQFKTIQGHYQLGTDYNGKVVFWYIDTYGNIRTGKIMQYSPVTGRRVRTINPTWVHYQKKIKHTQACFFGEHLIPMSYNPVGIVESEATACVASKFFPDITWVATGGKNNLASLLRRCEALGYGKREIILYPDLSENSETYIEWREIAEDFREQRYNITTSAVLEDQDVSIEDRKAGYDLRDYLITEMPPEESF